MRGPGKPLLISILLIVALGLLLFWPTSVTRAPSPAPPGSREEAAGGSLLFYCAAGMKAPVERIAKAYEQDYGIPVRLQYGGSGTLLANLDVARLGDLYLAADNSYMNIAREKGLVAETIPVGYLRPVIAVAKGNPKGIQSVDDFLRPEVKTALGSAEAASIGEETRAILERQGIWDTVRAAVQERGVFKPTVNDVANDVKIGAVDAAIVWDATVAQYPELEAVPLAGAEESTQTITIGVLTSSRHPTAALRFARYLTARDKGLPIFEEEGFPPAEGDIWEETPEILYYSGGINRLAIEDTLKAFEAREGCRITTVYNGCGILVGQMKLGQRPDVYHSCDISFMSGIRDLFEPELEISNTAMVIATLKGNPHGIATLADLAKPGLKLGLAHEEQSALGALTARLLKAEGLYEQIMPNVATHTPTADLLVNQIRTGSLDAVVVYAVNVVYSRDQLDIIPIDRPAASAVQTFATGKNSEHKRLVSRLLDALRSVESRRRFEKTGFNWAAK